MGSERSPSSKGRSSKGRHRSSKERARSGSDRKRSSDKDRSSRDGGSSSRRRRHDRHRRRRRRHSSPDSDIENGNDVGSAALTEGQRNDEKLIESSKRRKKIRIALAILVVLALAGAGVGVWWWLSMGELDGDDAEASSSSSSSSSSSPTTPAARSSSPSAAPSSDPAGPCFADFLGEDNNRAPFSALLIDFLRGATSFDDYARHADCVFTAGESSAVCDWSGSGAYRYLEGVCATELGGRILADTVTFCKEDMNPDGWSGSPPDLVFKDVPNCLPPSCGDEITALDLYGATSREGAFADVFVPSSSLFLGLNRTLAGNCSSGGGGSSSGGGGEEEDSPPSPETCHLCGSADVAMTTPEEGDCEKWQIDATDFVRNNEGWTCAKYFDEDFGKDGLTTQMLRIVCGCEGADFSDAPDACGYGCGEGKVVNPDGAMLVGDEQFNCTSFMAFLLFAPSDQCAEIEASVTRAAVQEGCCMIDATPV